MKTTLLTTSFLLFGLGLTAQTETQLAEYQANNPEKLIMTRANYELLDKSVQEIIASTIVFQDEIGLGIFGVGDGSITEAGSTQLTDVDFMKSWLAEHQDLKIVTRSEYNASRPDVQAIYNQPSILVLIGDKLTKQDILNF